MTAILSQNLHKEKDQATKALDQERHMKLKLAMVMRERHEGVI
jgi:hypothetical protein